MNGRSFPGALATLMALAVLAVVHSPLVQAQGAGKPLPAFAEVQKAVATYFEGLPGYEDGSLIVRSEAQAALVRVEQAGWRVADGGEIARRVPGDSEPLARLLRTPAGRKFAVRVSESPEGYDRVDRLLRLPRGEKIVEDLVRGPDGYKMIEYMTNGRGGAALGRQLERSPSGADFNQPTGRIYTVRALLERLKQSYETAVSGSASPN